MAKNMLRKLLPVVAGLGMVAAVSSNVVSCTQIGFAAGQDGQRVVVSTDGGHINDNSFNQDAYIGVKKFVKETYGLDGSSNYVEAGGADNASIISGYRLAILKKANAVVLPGFSHMSTLPSILPEFHKNHINTILVDGVNTDKSVVSLQFNSQISGVMAGFDTSYLFGTTYNKPGDPTSGLKYDVNNDGHIKIGTFAGASNKYGVDNYMWGLLLGMQIYNDIIKDGKIGDVPAVSVESANTTDGTIQSVFPNGNTDTDYYSGTFSLGGATKYSIPAKLIDSNRADVVFPVAGPQIQDVLSYHSTVGRAPYVIGVDVDQEGGYSDYKGRFVTSAIKNIDTAVPEALYRAHYDDDKDNTLSPKGATATGKENFEKAKGDKDAWLGKQPAPFVNWSIDYTDTSVPTNGGEGRYELKHHYLDLYDPNNTEVNASNAMWDINKFFADMGMYQVNGKTISKLKPQDVEAPSYMIGDAICKFAKELVENYGSDMVSGTDDTKQSFEVLNWNKPSNKKNNYDFNYGASNGPTWHMDGKDWYLDNPGLKK